MREDALRSILLVKAVEEADREGTLLPAADRAAATRDAVRERGESTAAADTALPAGLSFAKTPSGGPQVDLSALIRRHCPP